MLRGDNSERYGWLIGGGLISLSAAVYMIRDGSMKGENIHIFEEPGRLAWNNPMPDNEVIFKEVISDYENYTNFTDLLSEIPSVVNPKLSAEEEVLHFNKDLVNKLKETRPETNQTIINHYHSILLSLREWIKSQGGVFYQDTSVEKLEFKKYADTDEKVISAILYRQNSEKEKTEIGFEDIVIIGTEYNAEPIPEKCHNLAYCKISSEHPETVEDCITQARKAVYTFLGLEK